jgi:hypothetical protein
MAMMLSLVHGFFNGMQDFRTAMKISKMNAVDEKQPFRHLTCSKQFGN